MKIRADSKNGILRVRLLGELESSSEKFRYLGTYREML